MRSTVKMLNRKHLAKLEGYETKAHKPHQCLMRIKESSPASHVDRNLFAENLAEHGGGRWFCLRSKISTSPKFGTMANS